MSRPVAQDSGVSLEKRANAEVVSLGETVNYTVTIKNEGTRSINPTLTDVLPEELILRTDSISATTGVVESDDNTVVWSGSLAQGDEANIFYEAIPPSTSSPDQTITNAASLEFGDTSLEANHSLVTQARERNIWGQFVNLLAWILVSVNTSLKGIGIPYAFGFAIILLTVAVRLATFPLNIQQIKSSKAMQELQPKLKELQDKYKNDKEKLAQEQMAMYREHGVNPLGGCLPMIVQMPVWIALYQSLIQLSHEGLLNQGFFWIPSLAGPVGERDGGISWLFPFVNGAPPVGWTDAIAYIILPVLLVVSQLYMQKMMTPPTTDPQQASMQSMMKFMPLMFGYISLIVPSGLTLYWFTSNILALVQQYFTKTGTSTSPVPTPAGAVAVSSASSGSANAITTDSQEDNKDKNVKSKRRKSRRKR